MERLQRKQQAFVMIGMLLLATAITFLLPTTETPTTVEDGRPLTIDEVKQKAKDLGYSETQLREAAKKLNIHSPEQAEHAVRQFKAPATPQ